MNKIKYWIWTLLLGIGAVNGHSQVKEDYTPYTINTTYQKLKTKYPDIKPITRNYSTKISSYEDIQYKDSEAVNLKLDIYSPSVKTGAPFPAVLLIHGGGWLLGSKENQRVMAHGLAARGYVGIPISYRLGFEAKYPAAVNDIKDAIVWVKKHAKQYHIDAEKIVIMGSSAGAHLATLVGCTPDNAIYNVDESISNSVNAIVNVDGVVSLIHEEAAAESKSGKRSMAGIWLDGEKQSNYEKWQEASPLEYVGEHTPPTLFINSAQARFHAGRDDMLAILNNHNIYNETHTLADSPHSFWLLHPWYEVTLHTTVQFLELVFADE